MSLMALYKLGASGMCEFRPETEEDEEDVCESIEFERPFNCEVQQTG